MRNDLASITQQTPTMVQEQLALQWLGEAIRELGLGWAVDESDVLLKDVVPVSYTHLTLPTKRIV